MKKFQVILSLLLLIISIVSAQKDTIAIIDAGSSGSRLWVYEIDKNNVETKSLHNEKITPGLDSFAIKNDSAGLVNKIGTLLKNAGTKIKPNTKLYVLATAGMRMQDSSKAKTAYRQIKNWAAGKYKLDTAMTISGRYEGLYAWIAAGIKNGRIKENFGIIEIGGASMQQTFPSGFGDINRYGIKTYSKSYLGWGANEVKESGGTYKSSRKYSAASELQAPSYIGIWYKLGGGFYAFDGKYGKWLLENRAINFEEPQRQKTSDWTEGAAIDIIINKETPEGFDYVSPN